MSGVGRFPRGSLRGGRLALWICAALALGGVVFLWHGSQLQLSEVRAATDKCIQQQESLSAQLQVIFEYKTRLEKSLQQEKAEHRQTRDSLQAKADEERSLREKLNLEATNKFSSLQQQYKLLQSQHEDLEEEASKLRLSKLESLESKGKLESTIQAIRQELEQLKSARSKDLEDLKVQSSHVQVESERLLRLNKDLREEVADANARLKLLEKEKIHLQTEQDHLNRELQFCVKSPSKRLAETAVASSSVRSAPVGLAPAQESVVPQVASVSASPSVAVPVMANVVETLGKHSDKLQKQTTPQINPEAVLSHEKSAPVLPQAAPDVQPLPDIHPGEKLIIEQDIKGNQLHADETVNAGVAPAPPANEDWNEMQGHRLHLQEPLKHVKEHYNIPEGVVDPHQISLHQAEESAIQEKKPDDNIRHFQWQLHKQQPMGVAPLPDMGQKRVQQVEDGDQPQQEEDEDDEGGRLIPRQDNHQYHYNAAGADYPPDNNGKESHNNANAQLEEGEEEEDDDVDQIDYDGAQKRPPPIQIEAKHPLQAVQHHRIDIEHSRDSVMVNPK